VKNIPRNVWRSKLNEPDWNFACCSSGEVTACYRWEFQRERVQAQAGGTLPANPLTFTPTTTDLRRAWMGVGNLQKTRQIRAVPKGWIMHPDFPRLSYFEYRAKERWRPIREHETTSSSWIDTTWGDLIRHRAQWLQDALEWKVPHTLWIGGSNAEEVVPVCIPWAWSDADIIKAFREWLKEHRPRGESWDERPRVDEPSAKPKKKGGAGDPIRQARAKLKALAAWRLIQHYKGDNFDAFDHPGAAVYLGRQFDMPGAWSEAKAVVLRTLKENFGFTHFG
jgi:hypothetical protein